MSPELWPQTSSTASPAPICTPYTIPEGILIINDTFEVNLTENAVFRPRCDGGDSGVVHSGFSDNSTVTDLRPPFYASTSPQIFAIATATVISYILVVLIFITPRTFYVGGPGGGAGFLTRRGISGNSSVIGIGRRPLLQKIATVTVAVSLTIATAETFKVAKSQYRDGFMNSETMVREVVGAIEIRIAQVISDTFVWLAQVQTLIRLFPRHKEKVTIKWLGFALILLDVIFSCLNNFLPSDTNARPVRSRDAIPALSYLFELAIGFIYASCVIYYSISKYRFAFYHAKMRNICLVALISVTSVLIPVVFFVIDISSPDIASWGFYIRWVGAIAASVVVWEWVERIEALERDESKDGILGREIYDGDEMLDVTTVKGVGWADEKSRRHGHASGGHGTAQASKWTLGDKRRRLRSRIPFQNRPRLDDPTRATFAGTGRIQQVTGSDRSRNAPPPTVTTPISRLDNTSAASTVYTVRYHNVQTSSPEVLDEGHRPEAAPAVDSSRAFHPQNPEATSSDHNKWTSRPLWNAVANPFKRKRASPPAEVAGAQLLAENSRPVPAAEVRPDKGKLRSKLDTFTAVQRNRLRAHHKSSDVEDPLPVTVIPARPRGSRTWSPADACRDPDASKPGPAHNQNPQSRTGHRSTSRASGEASGQDLAAAEGSSSDGARHCPDTRLPSTTAGHVVEEGDEPPSRPDRSKSLGGEFVPTGPRLPAANDGALTGGQSVQEGRPNEREGTGHDLSPAHLPQGLDERQSSRSPSQVGRP